MSDERSLDEPQALAASQTAQEPRGEGWQDLLEQGRAGEALQAYRFGETLDEGTLAALRALRDIQSDLREKGYAKALKRLNELESRPDIVAWQTLESDLEQVQQSAQAFDKRNPEGGLAALESISTPLVRAEVATLLGTANVLMNETEQARVNFEAALEHDPKHYRAITNLGNLALEEGDPQAAIVAYEKALKLNDDFANAHHNLGVAYRRQGNITKSVRHLRKAQNASQKQLREEARASFSQGGKGAVAKYGRWLLFGTVALVALYLLRSRGII